MTQHRSPASRGIEVLIKKASVDLPFASLLLEDASAAADAIGLELTPGELAMLQSIPAQHLATTIANTEVPPQRRRVFLGKAAAVMLATLAGAQIPIESAWAQSGGFGGFIPGPIGEFEAHRSRVTDWGVLHVAAKELGIDQTDLDIDTRISDVAKSKEAKEFLRKAFEDYYKTILTKQAFGELVTFDDASRRLDGLVRAKQPVLRAIASQTDVAESNIKVGMSFESDLKIDRAGLVRIRRDLVRELRVYFDWEEVKQRQTVGELIDYAGSLMELRVEANRKKEIARKARAAARKENENQD